MILNPIVKKNTVGAEGGITPSGTLSIVTNGTHDVSGYASAEVDVETPAEELSVTANGEYFPPDGEHYSAVYVDVPETPTEELTVTANGEYTPSAGKHFSKVTVNVAQSGGSGGGGTGSNILEIYARGTGYAPGASYTHALAVTIKTINSRKTIYLSVDTECVYTFDEENYEEIYSYPVSHVASLDTLSESDTVEIDCENIRGDGTPVAVYGDGCTATSEYNYGDSDDGYYGSSTITITGITNRATVTLNFDADY